MASHLMATIQLDDSQSIIDYCRSCPEDQIVGGLGYCNQVIKLPDQDIAVKFGIGVQVHEAESLRASRRGYRHNPTRL